MQAGRQGIWGLIVALANDKERPIQFVFDDARPTVADDEEHHGSDDAHNDPLQEADGGDPHDRDLEALHEAHEARAVDLVGELAVNRLGQGFLADGGKGVAGHVVNLSDQLTDGQSRPRPRCRRGGSSTAPSRTGRSR